MPIIKLNTALLCLAALWWAAAARAQEASDTPMAFKGVTPGTTTERELLSNRAWGQPKMRTTRESGDVQLEFDLRGYALTAVTLRGGTVQTIDVALTQGTKREDVAAALTLGHPLETKELPAAAKIGVEIPGACEPVRHSAGCVIVFADKTNGQARLVRLFAPRVIEAVAAAGPANATGGQPPALAGPTEQTETIVKAVVAQIESTHLAGRPVDDEVARRTMTILLRDIDPSASYFTQADIARFKGRQEELDNELRLGDASTFYDVFRSYQARVEERMKLVTELLDAEHDFTVDEEFVAGTSDASYAENNLEVREIWRKRVKHQLLVHMAAGAELAEARKLAERQFRSTLEGARAFTDDGVLAYALSSLAAAYDPNSSYMTAQQYKDYAIQTRARLEGIGASLKAIDGYITVMQVVSGGPAARDGRLRAGDRIVEIGQGDSGEMVNVIGRPLSEVVALIRGEPRTSVRLRVLSPGQFETKVYKLLRDKVDLARVAGTVLVAEHLPPGRAAQVGYIHVPSFYANLSGDQPPGGAAPNSASADVQRLLDDFRKSGVQLVVLDVRNNSGGTLTESLKMAGLFVGGGTTLRAVGRDSEAENYGISEAKIVWDGPTVLLTNKASAGASEILAAALQDYRRALVIGDTKTSGFGTVQSLDPVRGRAGENAAAGSLGYLKLTRQRFYRPSGKSTQLEGVAPDVVLPSLTEVTAEGEDAKRFALKGDSIDPAQFQPTSFGIDAALIKDLIARSEARRDKSAHFQKLAERIEAQRASAGTWKISLNKEKFLAAQKPRDESADDPALPGVPDVKVDGNLSESLAVALDYLGRRQLASGESDYQQRRYADAARKYQAAVAADSESPLARYKLSWLLATSPERSVRDGKAAVEHAQRACELDGNKSWSYVLALAVAHAQAGDFEAAQKHLQTALEKAPEAEREKYRPLEQQFRNRQAF
ncbi:MAG: carboxy terminal-processing peptidase [Planctomycetia bacterium]|nr:carboxy terminal-processing peptidase [Planctomycetia bacterium]